MARKSIARKLLTVAAVYWIALQAILTGFAPPTMAMPSTLAVICHGEAGASDNSAPQEGTLPVSCVQCALCNVAPQASTPDDGITLSLAPAFGETIAAPVFAPPRTPDTSFVSLPRGPPRTV